MNNESKLVSLWSGDRVVATQPAEFVDVAIKYSANLARSPQPENPANREGESWGESEQICPDCGQLLWTASWWDDSSDCGGSAIGTLFKCGNCGYQDSI